jgi:dTDP-4-amino-4,6-dideoxygalactose transaminase
MAANSTSMNLILEELEKEIAKYIGTRYAVLCSSGRTAIRLSLLSLGIGHSDEVVIPDFACQILPITVFCAGAVPKFCDIDRHTLALSPTYLPEVLGPNTKAVIFVPLFGLPVDPSPILEIANKRGIAFIDDAAQALGASTKGKKAGSFGNVGILTFNKSLNVDLGAAVTTNDGELTTKIKLIREKYESKSFFATIGYRMIEFSRLKSRKIMKTVFQGDKYLQKLLNITLAKKHFQIINGWVEGNPHVLKLWRSNALTTDITNQLMSYGRTYTHRRKLEKAEILYLTHEFENFEKCLQDRRRIAKMYDELIMERNLSKIIVPTNSASSYLRYPILFSDKNKLLKCIKELIQAGFHVDGRYEPLHVSPFFDLINKKNFNFKESIYVSEHILPLPVKNLNAADPKKIEKVASIVNLNSSK